MAAAAATLLPVVTLPVTVSPRADPAQTEKTVVLGRKPTTRIAPAAMDEFFLFLYYFLFDISKIYVAIIFFKNVTLPPVRLAVRSYRQMNVG